MDQNRIPNNPPDANSGTPRPQMLICYLLNGVCIAMVNGQDSSRRMSAPPNNPQMKEIVNILGIKENTGLGVEIHFVDTKTAWIKCQDNIKETTSADRLKNTDAGGGSLLPEQSTDSLRKKGRLIRLGVNGDGTPAHHPLALTKAYCTSQTRVLAAIGLWSETRGLGALHEFSNISCHQHSYFINQRHKRMNQQLIRLVLFWGT